MNALGSDVVVLGAGPTGCALGAYLARRGARVTLIEAVERPESAVGESMLPCASPVFEELGLDMSGFVVKHGAVFCEGGASVRFDFSEAETPRSTSAWQVQREVFDLRWRDVARREGCTIVYGRALEVDLPTRTLHTTAGAYTGTRIIDCGGRDMWLARRLGERIDDPTLRNAALGTRMRGVRQLPPDEPGDITICALAGGWIWIIPFGGGVASVGVVMTRTSPLRQLAGTPVERLRAAIAASPDAAARLAEAEPVLPLRGLQDYTATSTRFFGADHALCGDAATFIDPVFSSGVLLGLVGARGLAAALDSGDLTGWEAGYREGAGVFRKVIDCWYAGEFMSVALAPRSRQKPYFRQGITTLLAGDVFDPARTSPRRMADRMPDLARHLREA